MQNGHGHPIKMHEPALMDLQVKCAPVCCVLGTLLISKLELGTICLYIVRFPVQGQELPGYAGMQWSVC